MGPPEEPTLPLPVEPVLPTAQPREPPMLPPSPVLPRLDRLPPPSIDWVAAPMPALPAVPMLPAGPRLWEPCSPRLVPSRLDWSVTLPIEPLSTGADAAGAAVSVASTVAETAAPAAEASAAGRRPRRDRSGAGWSGIGVLSVPRVCAPDRRTRQESYDHEICARRPPSGRAHPALRNRSVSAAFGGCRCRKCLHGPGRGPVAFRMRRKEDARGPHGAARGRLRGGG